MRTQKHKSLYDKDFYKWSNEQAMLLKKGDFSKVDLKNVIEEIESLAKRDKRALGSQLTRLLQHMLKLEYTPEKKGNSKSWLSSVVGARIKINSILEDSPSLKNEIKKMIDSSYSSAMELAISEFDEEDEGIFPTKCPWTLKEILGK
jgi:hypothetical protein